MIITRGKLIDIGCVDLWRFGGLPWECVGIAPDIRVEQTEADILVRTDKQLECAIEMLK